MVICNGEDIVVKYMPTRKKSLTFKIVYLVLSVAVEAYCLYLLIERLVHGIEQQLVFDDIVLLIATLVAVLFEGSIIGFIVRSFKFPTLLMKNLVFKNDGTPYLPGLIIVCIGVVLSLAACIAVAISAFATDWIKISLPAQRYILAVGAIVLVNLGFTLAYFITFRHESGSFAII